jgi:hypothetical protein
VLSRFRRGYWTRPSGAYGGGEPPRDALRYARSFLLPSFSSTAAFSTLEVYRRLEPPSGRRIFISHFPSTALLRQCISIQTRYKVHALLDRGRAKKWASPRSYWIRLQDPANEFPRTPALGNSVNKGSSPSTTRMSTTFSPARVPSFSSMMRVLSPTLEVPRNWVCRISGFRE